MNRIKWKSNKNIDFQGSKIFCGETMPEELTTVAGIRKDSRFKAVIKKILWPLINMRDRFFVDGFIKKSIGELISGHIEPGTVLLDIGCGNMELRRYLPSAVCYNAIDVSFSEFQLKRIVNIDNRVNIAIAAASDIPVESKSVDIIVSTECFDHIPDIDKTMDEIHRIAMPSAKLICSISNNQGYKYTRKGKHGEHVHYWKYREFIEFMESRNFKFISGFWKGVWIPIPSWITKTSYQLPIALKNDYYNTNLFYVFEVLSNE